MKNVVILCLFVCLQNPIERKSILKRCKLFSNHSLKNSALLSFWGGVPVNRPTSLCIEKDSHFTYLITYDIFTFKVWFENNLHRSIMKVFYCAIGFCKETNEQRMKTFLSEQHATNRNKDSNDFKMVNVHFARPNPMQICACAWIYRWTKKLSKTRTEPQGIRAAGPPGRGAVAGCGPRACFKQNSLPPLFYSVKHYFRKWGVEYRYFLTKNLVKKVPRCAITLSLGTP